MNIVLIVFDSLRKDCISVYGEPPWYPVHTPHLDAFVEESLVMTRAFPESLPTLPARRALYTGQRVYPFRERNFIYKGDAMALPGWGPIPEEHDTVSEVLQQSGYRTALISDVPHMFKPSKNFWRGFDQWTFIRGQERDLMCSGPEATEEELDYWIPGPRRHEHGALRVMKQNIMNTRHMKSEEDHFVARVFRESTRWIEQNLDADKFFLTIESFTPHQIWMVPEYYRRMYLGEDGPEQVISDWSDVSVLDPYLL
ncbi:sulfatase-like hydrolase/transferase, partial [Candidatus Hydrogenedentota bacterium]